MSVSGWIGVDLDGTLAKYHGWDGGNIGEPVPAMVDRVKAWLAEGVKVKVFTARVADVGRDSESFVEEQKQAIYDWCEKHIGVRLDVTCSKDLAMVELWDDRCVAVEVNTGRVLGGGK